MSGSRESQLGVFRFKEAPMGVPGLESSRVFAGTSFRIGGEGVLARGLLVGKSVVLPERVL